MALHLISKSNSNKHTSHGSYRCPHRAHDRDLQHHALVCQCTQCPPGPFLPAEAGGMTHFFPSLLLCSEERGARKRERQRQNLLLSPPTTATTLHTHTERLARSAGVFTCCRRRGSFFIQLILLKATRRQEVGPGPFTTHTHTTASHLCYSNGARSENVRDSRILFS